MTLYAATMERTASATLAVGALTAAASNPRRFKLCELIVGQSHATPADGATLFEVQRCTTAGTAGSAVTPTPLDPGDTIAATTVCGQAHSADPTLTAGAIPLKIPCNQRSTFRWVAQPGRELIAPATANNGFAIRTPTAALVATVANAIFEEQ